MPVDRYILTTLKFGCPKCGETVKKLQWNYDPAPEHCGVPMESDIGQFGKAPCVIGDDIPGGMLVSNAICNPDGSPRRFDSHSAMRKAAAESGYTNMVQHVPTRGSDKSPHTTRWI